MESNSLCFHLAQGFLLPKQKSVLVKSQGIFTTTALALVKRGLGAMLPNKQSAISATIALLAVTSPAPKRSIPESCEPTAGSRQSPTKRIETGVYNQP